MSDNRAPSNNTLDRMPKLTKPLVTHRKSIFAVGCGGRPGPRRGVFSVDDVIATVDIERLACDEFRAVHREKCYGNADIVDRYQTTSRSLLEGTATLGIVSAVMRTELGHEAFEDYLQIDAQINPGNSGGALVNSNGELIGINTAMGGLRGRSFSIGFAIPINMAMTITHQIRLHRRMHRGSLGVTVDDLVTERGGSTRPPLTGAIVTNVLASTPAESAGIKPGDIIVEVAGKPVRNASEFAMRVATVPLGGQIQVKIHSNDQDRKVSIRVIDAEIKPVQKLLSSAAGTMAGAAIGDIMPGSVLYGDIRGAQILEAPLDSPAYAAGLSAGDVVTAIDGRDVFSSEDLLRYLNEVGTSYRVDIVRNGIPYWLQAQK